MSSVTVRLDEATKTQATAILEGLGLDISSATRAFYRQVILRRGLPFDVAYPDGPLTVEAESRFARAEQAVAAGATGYKSADELFTDVLR